mgnify:CR=1 FL=1
MNEQRFMDPDKGIFPISVVAEILDVHQRTLRIYDEENLISPSRSHKNRRLYSYNDIQKGKFVQYLTRSLGINIMGTKIIMNLLTKLGVDSDEYINFINQIATNVNISEEIQEQTRQKMSRKGRKTVKTITK